MSLREEGVRNTRVLGAPDTPRPIAVLENIKVLKLHMDLAVSNRLAVLITDFKPLVDLLSVQEVRDRQVRPPDERRPNGVVDLDGEDDVGSHVRAVDVEGLVPTRIDGLVGDHTCTPDAGLLQINGGIYLGAALADTHGILDPFHKLLKRNEHVVLAEQETNPVQREAGILGDEPNID